MGDNNKDIYKRKQEVGRALTINCYTTDQITYTEKKEWYIEFSLMIMTVNAGNTRMHVEKIRLCTLLLLSCIPVFSLKTTL